DRLQVLEPLEDGLVGPAEVRDLALQLAGRGAELALRGLKAQPTAENPGADRHDGNQDPDPGHRHVRLPFGARGRYALQCGGGACPSGDCTLASVQGYGSCFSRKVFRNRCGVLLAPLAVDTSRARSSVSVHESPVQSCIDLERRTVWLMRRTP